MTKLRVASFCTILAVLRIGAAGAASIIVDTTADDVAGNGNCTLREAVLAANSDAPVDGCAAGAGADTITVPAGTYALTLTGPRELDTGATGDLDVTGDLDLVGGGAPATILDGMATDRVLEVRPGAHVSVTGVTIQNGVAGPDGGGGVSNGGTLALTDSVVRANHAFGSRTDLVYGGGIESYGPLTVVRTVVEANGVAGGPPRPPYPSPTVLIGAGGGIAAWGPVVVRDSIIRQNVVDVGNGLLASGGGLWAGSAATVEGSTVTANVATGRVTGGPFIPSTTGGGLQLDADGTIRNSTLTDNVARSGSDAFLKVATLENVTIAGSLAGTTVYCRNSIVASCVQPGGSGSPLTTVANAYNLTTDPGCAFWGTDRTVADLGLDPLADNGGPTPTRTPAPGSPALEQGSPALPGSGGTACLATDQRGTRRPQGGRCDVGAVESGPAPVASTTTTTPDPSSTTSTSTSTTSSSTTTTVPLPCAPTPRIDCLGAATPHGAALVLRRTNASHGDRLRWSWRSATPVAGGDFGTPLATTSLTLCLYDATGLRFRTTGEAGSGWAASGTGFTFRRDRSGPLEPDRMSLRARPRRAGHIEVIDRVLGLPALPLAPPVRVQVGRDDGGPCWEGLITTPGANTARRFRGRSD